MYFAKNEAIHNTGDKKLKVVFKHHGIILQCYKMNITVVNSKDGNKLEKQVFYFVYM